MLDHLRNLLVPAGQFRIARARRGLPDCDIRLLREEDIDRCEEIYRANEAAHFPDGYFPKFSAWLRERQALILVAESAGQVQALCGISAQDLKGSHVAALSFGMAHPSQHRRGYGTALLLTRLSMLKTPKPHSMVLLTTSGGSESFYKRFGFKFTESLQPTPAYREDHYYARVTGHNKRQCAAFLGRAVRLSPELATATMPKLPDPQNDPTVADSHT